jgi:hypothetical protein
MNIILTTFVGFVVILAGIAGITSLLPTTLPTPETAVVYFNDTEQVFYPEPCVTVKTYELNRNKLRISTYLEVLQNDYTQGLECRLTITQKGRSVFLNFVSSLGFLDPLPSRWDETGHWKY